MSKPPNNFGYLVIYEKSDTIFLGAILTVNENGIPQEYAVTDEVIVTPLQRHLYGSTLKSYLASEVCGKQLISNLKEKPTLIMVKDESLLNLKNNNDVNMIYLDERKHMIEQQDLNIDIKNALKKMEDKDLLLEPFSRIEKALEEDKSKQIKRNQK